MFVTRPHRNAPFFSQQDMPCCAYLWNARVRLTRAGERFLRRARKVLQQIEDGANDVAAIGRAQEGGGIFSSLASGFLFDLLCAFDREHVAVRIELIEGNPSENIADVRQLQLDVAFITGRRRWEDCETEPLWSERVYAVLPVDHHLAAQDELRWHDLAHESYIVSNAAPGADVHEHLVQKLADLGHHPEIQAHYVGRDVLLSMVALGRGLTLTSEATTGAQFPGIAYRPIANEQLLFSAIWSPRNDNPAFRRFISMARAMTRVDQPFGSSRSQDGAPSYT